MAASRRTGGASRPKPAASRAPAAKYVQKRANGMNGGTSVSTNWTNRMCWMPASRKNGAQACGATRPNPDSSALARSGGAGAHDDAAGGQDHGLQGVGPVAAEGVAGDRLRPVQAQRPAQDQDGGLERRLARPAAGQDGAAAGHEQDAGDVGGQVLLRRIGRPRRRTRHDVVAEHDVLEAEADEGQREEQPAEAFHWGHGGAVYAAPAGPAPLFDERSAGAGRARSRRRDPGRRPRPGKRLACDTMSPAPHAADA